ncbi:TIR domain-containing protein [Desulfococcaceae bacterium HSG9]|nr:TIR domain-containing protein [Desulfococcaceae bacterium HSG9]
MNPIKQNDSDSKCDVLLLFVNDNERKAVFDAAKEFDSAPKPYKKGIYAYHDFGVINSARVMGLQTRMGAVGRGASGPATLTAIQTLDPDYVIAVGIAFGMNRDKQKIGDILVSNQVIGYNIGKMDKQGQWITRSDKASASEGLYNNIQSASAYWQGAKIHFDLIVSGEALIDNDDFKQQILNAFPEAVGGEMEAMGIYASCESLKKDWIIIKAVCDYADGQKDDNKEEYQKQAAQNAATFVFHSFKYGFFGKADEHKEVSIGDENHQAPKPDVHHSAKTAQYDIYISCVVEDQKIALKLYNDLKNLDLKPWLYSKDAKPGGNKKAQMHEAIQNSRYFMPLISAHSVSQRGLVQRELNIASDILDEFAMSDIFIIPIRLDNTRLTDYRFQNIELANFTHYAEGFKQLRRVLISDS